MSDLILNISISESKKKGRIVLETFEGTIPHLKNKQYSGPLRNANINGIIGVDNFMPAKFEMVKNFLNSPNNVQINKYQYLLSNAGLCELTHLVKYGCLFYKDKGTPMFEVEDISMNAAGNRDYIDLNNIQIAYDKTSLFLKMYVPVKRDVIRRILPKAYVNINEKGHPLELVFDYDDFSVSYDDENRIVGTDNDYRDFGVEEKIVKEVKNCGWNHGRNVGFIYEGKDFSKDVMALVSVGIEVFTDSNTRIVRGDFSDIHVSYGIDWFEIKGNVSVDGEYVDIADLVNFKEKKENWVEINGKMLFLSDTFGSVLKSADISGDSIKLDKSQLLTAVEIAYEVNGGKVIGIEQLTDYDRVELTMDKKLLTILRPYQKTGVKWLLSLNRNGFGGCLADDMGLGKTLQIIAYLTDSIIDGGMNLIVVPKTLLINWNKEFQKFSPETSVLIYHGIGRESADIRKYKVIITTYGTVLNDINLLSDIQFANLVIDEAQHIKNQKTKIYRAIRSLKAKTRLILTGTPVENNIQEYWGLMKLANPIVFSKINPFQKNAENDQVIERIKRLTAPFLLRRMKKEVLTDLPEKQEQILFCKMESMQQELYDKMLASIQYEIKRKNDRYEIKSNSIMLNGLLYLQEICCPPQLLGKEFNPNGCKESAKLDQLLDVLGDLYSSGHKVVIFSRFTRMLKIIENKLTRLHYNTFYLDGKTSKRMQVVEEFERSKTGVFMISLKAGGTGLNLVSADTAIIYDPWWNPAIEKQAEDRIYRIGQTKNVMIYKMIVEGTIEEKVQLLQKEKSQLYADILNGHEIPMSMTADMMRNLLMNR